MSQRRKLASFPFIALVCVAAVSALWSCGESAPAPPASPSPSPPPNVLLISIDTLRADHLGAYGYPQPTSPGLDAFREDAVLFETAIAHAPSTLHSHASMLTSLLPHQHRASWGAKTRLPEGVVSVPEVFKEAGYATAAFAGGGQMDKIFGLAQGFDEYWNAGAADFAGTVLRGLEWIDGRAEGPFFLFLHTYEVHHPYEPKPEHLALFEDGYEGDLPDDIEVELLKAINRGEVEIDEADVAHIVATYDAEIRSMDEGFAGLIAELKTRGLYDDMLIVLTSDHGEEFGEHERVGWHSHSLYDELLRVPLIVKYPGGEFAGASVGEMVRSIDIPPTMLAAAEIPSPKDFLGVDLEPFATGNPPEEELVAISRIDRTARRDISSVRTLNWKLYSPWLFNLEFDPEEKWNTAASHRETVRDLQARFDEAVASRKRWDPPTVAPPRTTLKELQDLGYIE